MSWLRDRIEQAIEDQAAHYKRVEHALAIIINEQRHIKELIMASKQDVLDSINGLSSDLDTDFTNISNDIAALQSNGGTIEASDLDGIKAAVDALRTKTTGTLGTIGTAVTSTGNGSNNAAKAQ